MQSRPLALLFLGVLVAVAVGLSVYVISRIHADASRPVSDPAPPRQAVQPSSASAKGVDNGWRGTMARGLPAYRQKRPEEAVRLYADALALAEKSGRDTAIALVLSNSGSLYWSMGRLEEAEAYLLRAIGVIDKLSQAQIVGELGTLENLLSERTHQMLGVVYRGQGKDVEAARHFTMAVAAARQVTGIQPGTLGFVVAGNLYNLAMAQCNLGQKDEARKSLAEGRKANSKAQSSPHYFESMDRLEANMDSGRACGG